MLKQDGRVNKIRNFAQITPAKGKLTQMTLNTKDFNSLNSPEAFAALGGNKLVYVREVSKDDVIDDITDENGQLEIDIPEGTTLYALHAADGSRIALLGDRDVAFAAARQHEMNPVSVH